MFKSVERPRRLRTNPLLREFIFSGKPKFIMPFFVRHGKNIKNKIDKMPGQFQYSIDTLIKELKSSKLNAVLIFGIPKTKDKNGSEAFAKNGIVQQAVKAIKDNFPKMLVFADTCLCEYTSHGQCGVVKKTRNGYQVGNDPTLELLQKTALSQATAGADCICPSSMMDNQVLAIRTVLDENSVDIPIMSYSAKFASSFYGPFRAAAESTPKVGDRKGYQLPIASTREALREIEIDVKQGADIIMVKPALAYLDIITKAREKCNLPIAAYSVSGEYSLVKAAAEKQFVNEKEIRNELLNCIFRAGADIIITYWAKDLFQSTFDY